jgi:hypothetical protein
MSSRRGRHLIPSDLWDKRDWREHYQEQLYQPINKVPQPPEPVHSLPPGFSLHADTERRRKEEERSHQVDRFLEAMKVRPRRRAR